MRYIIDASVGFKCVVPEILTPKALQIRGDFRKGVHDLLSPDLYPIELGNSLAAAGRSGRFPASDFPTVYTDMMGNLPIIYPSLSLLPRAYEISCQNRVSVYDAIYVALAEKEGCDLVTADDKLIKALPGYPIISLSAL